MIELIGHRGYPALYPENTMLSFRKAAEAGCNGIELDIALTKDNKVVVIHDKTIDRTTGGKGYVNSYTLKEIKRFDAGRGERIPALEEVLKAFTGLKILLELKVSKEDSRKLPEEAVKLVSKLEAKERCVFISFNLDALRTVRKLEPSAATGLIFSKTWPVADEIEFLPEYIDLICPRRDRLNSTVNAFAEQNRLALYVWTVDTEEEVKEAKKYRITGIVSNDPGKVKKYI